MVSPLQLVAGSRRSLIISFVVGVVPLCGVAWAAADYIRESSGSPSLDLLLITGWMLSALLVAIIGALAIADVLFTPGWREVNILGKRLDLSEEDADMAMAGASTRSQALPLAGLVIVVLVALVMLTHTITQGFLSWYGVYGYATSTLRGDNADRKVAILEEMTRAQDDRLIQYTEMMAGQLEAPDAAVRLQAVWSLGEVARRMARSIELMERGEKGAKWVYSLNEWLLANVEPRLSKAFQDSSAGERGRALAFALAAIRSPDRFGLFRSYLERPDRDPEIVREIVVGLSNSPKPSHAAGLLRPLLLGDDAQLVGLAAWSIGEMYGLGTGGADEEPIDEAIVAVLRQRLTTLPFEGQCLVMDALVRIRAEQLAKPLFTVFESIAPTDRRCQRLEVARKFEAPLSVSKEEEAREKVLKALAAIAEGNPIVTSWLRSKADDESVASGLRSDMRHILRVTSERP